MAPNSDARALIRAARIGSPGALNELLGLFRAQIRYEAGIRLEGALKSKLDSSDAAQGVLMRATERFDQFRGESPAEFTAWLRTILANHLRDEQRRYRSESRAIGREIRLGDLELFDAQCAELLASEADETTSEAARRELSLKVAQALEELPASARELLVLRNFDQLEWSEVADRLQTTPDAARMRWSRAIHQLGMQLRPFAR
ncbi:MAG: sigma-70 family RNA polymerase sigma factor [Planctomycetota bacterium]|jgi:RNA polymerase sigma-70 factor (ECF subfamily)